jgi:hypothetical protein
MSVFDFSTLPPMPPNCTELPGTSNTKVLVGVTDSDTILANLHLKADLNTAFKPEPAKHLLDAAEKDSGIKAAIRLWDSYELPYDEGLNNNTTLLVSLQENRFTRRGEIEITPQTVRSRRGIYKSSQSFWSTLRSVRDDIPNGVSVVTSRAGVSYRGFTFPYIGDEIIHLMKVVGLQGWYTIRAPIDSLHTFRTAEDVHSSIEVSLEPAPIVFGEYGNLTAVLHNVPNDDALLAIALVMLPIANRRDPHLAEDLARLTALWSTLNRTGAYGGHPDSLWPAYVLRRVHALWDQVKGTPLYEVCIEGALYRMRLIQGSGAVKRNKTRAKTGNDSDKKPPKDTLVVLPFKKVSAARVLKVVA